MPRLYAELVGVCKTSLKTVVPKALGLAATAAVIGIGIAAVALGHHVAQKSEQPGKKKRRQEFAFEERRTVASHTSSRKGNRKKHGSQTHVPIMNRPTGSLKGGTTSVSSVTIPQPKAIPPVPVATIPPISDGSSSVTDPASVRFTSSRPVDVVPDKNRTAIETVNHLVPIAYVPNAAPSGGTVGTSLRVYVMEQDRFDTLVDVCTPSPQCHHLPTFQNAYGYDPAVIEAKSISHRYLTGLPRVLGPPPFLILHVKETCRNPYVDKPDGNCLLPQEKGDSRMLKESWWQSHEDYIDFVMGMNQQAYAKTGQSLFRTPSDKFLAIHMTYFDLDLVKPLVMSLYSEEKGRPPLVQETMRSLFLYTASLGKTGMAYSLDEWVIELSCRKELQVLIGCSSPDSIPSLGGHYGFLDRVWAGAKERYSRKAEYDACANYTKGKMCIGEDNKILDTAFETEVMDRLYRSGIPLGRNNERISQQLLAFLAIYPSMENGCIPKVVCAGCDSSALPEHGSKFGRCKCGRNRLFCQYRGVCGMSAKFSAPDGSVGFDSGEDTKFFGQHLVLLSCTNPVIHTDLPLSYSFVDANRHDSVTIYVAFLEFHRNMSGVYLHYLLGDKAFGSNDLARTMLEEGTIPLFDLASNRRNPKGLPKEVTLNMKNAPCCHDGVQMTLVRNDDKNQCWVYGCPLKSGERKECPLANTCAIKDTEIIINPKDDPNIFPIIPKEDEIYRKIYNLRSGNERVNDRILNDYHLADIQTRNVHHRSLFTSMACILIHQDAWYKVGIPPKGKKARAFFYQLDDEIRDILKKRAPKRIDRPEPGRKVDTDAIMRMLLGRNREEKMVEAIRSLEVHNFYERLEEEMKDQSVWTCPADELKERETGLDPLLSPPEPPRITAHLSIDWYERYFVKKWEKTWLPYIPPTVFLDPEGIVQYPTPSPFRLITEGKYKGWTEFDPDAAKEPPTVKGFTLLKEGVWVRPSPGIATVQEEPSAVAPSCTETNDFVNYELTSETCHSLTYTPPVIAGITWEPASEVKKVSPSPTGQTEPADIRSEVSRDPAEGTPKLAGSVGNKTTRKLERDNRYRSQPLPYRYARENLKMYERRYTSLPENG